MMIDMKTPEQVGREMFPDDTSTHNALRAVAAAAVEKDRAQHGLDQTSASAPAGEYTFDPTEPSHVADELKKAADAAVEEGLSSYLALEDDGTIGAYTDDGSLASKWRVHVIAERVDTV